MHFPADYPEADFDTLMRQAPSTIALYMDAAIEHIDRSFGKGYAKEHPQVLSAFITASSADFNHSVLSKAIGTGLEKLSSALREGNLEVVAALGAIAANIGELDTMMSEWLGRA